MSTWDDKPNDYEHAVAIIEELRAALTECAAPWGSPEFGVHTWEDIARTMGEEFQRRIRVAEAALEEKR